MVGRRAGVVTGQLGRAAERFARWRRTRTRGARIPETLWELAAGLAVSYGVCKTAGLLRLDYYGLKKRVEAKAAGGGAGAKPSAELGGLPTFVELPRAPVNGAGEWVIEFESQAGAKMRVQLKGGSAPDLVALSSGFWRSQQ